MPAYAKPKQSDIFDPNWGSCAYCGSTADGPLVVTKQMVNDKIWSHVITRYIYNCKNHEKDAARDLRAHLHLASSVLFNDVLLDPLFRVINDSIVVERANRSYFDYTGWKIDSSKSDDVLVQKIDGCWTISVINSGDPTRVITKNIPVSDLKLSLTEDGREGMVDAFIERLDAGFYKQEYEAHHALVP